MKTRRFLRKPSHARPHFPAQRSVRAPIVHGVVGDWRYAAPRRTRWATLLALVAALGLHAMVLLTGNAPVRARGPVRPAAEPVLQLEMPPLPPEPAEESPRELAETASSAVAVPQLADVPSTVALSAFSQELDLRPRPELDLGALKTLAIPVARGRSGGPLGAEAIFSLAQLDRVPQPIAQPSPALPRDVRTELSSVEVVVEFVVDADGRVTEPRVTRTDAPEFSAAAVEGVRRWKFRPGVLAGRKVATRMEVPLKFDLRKPE